MYQNATTTTTPRTMGDATTTAEHNYTRRAAPHRCTRRVHCSSFRRSLSPSRGGHDAFHRRRHHRCGTQLGRGGRHTAAAGVFVSARAEGDRDRDAIIGRVVRACAYTRGLAARTHTLARPSTSLSTTAAAAAVRDD